MRKIIIALCLGAAVAACSSADTQNATILRPSAGGLVAAGPGDIVLEMRLAQPLPNAFGKADIFGRTKDAGRIAVRYLGNEGGKAIFARQDTAIQSDETTLSRSPIVLPTYQNTTMSGAIGTLPVNAQSTTTGVSYLPPTGSQSFVQQSGQILLSALPGGSILVEGHRLTLRRFIDGGIEYSIL